MAVSSAVAKFEYAALPTSASIDVHDDALHLEPGDEVSHIRVMSLHPGSPDDRIFFDLVIFSIRYNGTETRVTLDAPPFEAVSYCWGGDARLAQIWCGNKALNVSVTVHEMLLHLRNPTGVRWLWIDAICIDQSNLSERAYQVASMRLIYSSAARTLVWLGPGTDKARAAFDAVGILKDVRAKLQLHPGDFIRYSDPGLSPAIKRYHGLPSSSEKDQRFEALAMMLNNPYFERVWIIQEVAVAREAVVLHGNATVPWHDFAQALFLAYDLRIVDTVDERVRTSMINVQYLLTIHEAVKEGTLPALRVLLNLYRHAKATDPRDKVYALVGISSSTRAGHPNTLSYSASLADAYRLWTVLIMEHEASLEILSAANKYPKSRELDRYSWVPDWSFSGDSKTKHVSSWPAVCLQATMKSKLALRESNFQDNFKILGLEGYVIDQVESIGMLVNPEAMSYSIFLPTELLRRCYFYNAIWRDWEAVAGFHRRCRYEATDESMVDAFWQTVSYGQLGFDAKSIEQGKNEFRVWFEFYRRAYIFADWFKLYLFAPLWLIGLCLSVTYIGLFVRRKLRKEEVGYWKFQERLIIAIGWRRIIRTRNGLISLASHGVQVGDSIALFEGGRIPLTIRQAANHWRLTGDAYVHGVMQGERWDGQKCTTYWIE